MKKCMVLLAVIIAASGCRTKQDVKFERDVFKGTNSAVLKMKQSASKRVAETVYSREFSNSGPAPVHVEFIFITTIFDDTLDPKIYYKVNDKTFEYVIKNIKMEEEVVIKSKQSKTEASAEYITKSQKRRFRGRIDISAEMEQELLKADEMFFRVYFGKEIVTFNVSKKLFPKIKNLINAKPSEASPGSI